MLISLRFLAATVSMLALLIVPCAAQSPPSTPSTAPAPAEPPSPTQKPEPVAPTGKAEPKKSKKNGESKSKQKKETKERKESSGFDPKTFLLKLVLNADDDGDGALDVAEFRKVPLLKELKKERVDSLFAEIDANSNASLDEKEIGKGFGKITSLAKENRALLDDADAAKQAKKLKRLTE